MAENIHSFLQLIFFFDFGTVYHVPNPLVLSPYKNSHFLSLIFHLIACDVIEHSENEKTSRQKSEPNWPTIRIANKKSQEKKMRIKTSHNKL